MKKRILAAVLTAVMAMGALTGCGSTAGKDNYTIGIMQYAVHGWTTVVKDLFRGWQRKVL